LSEKYFEAFLKELLVIQGAKKSIAHAKTKGESISQHEQRANTESATSKPI